MSTRSERRRWRRMLLIAAMVPVVALFIGACGGDDDGDSGRDGDGGETASTEPIKIGILSDCEGAFGGFFELNIGGALVPFINRGAEPANPNKPSEGVTNAEIAGREIEFVTPFGCADDTPEAAIAETRRIMEREGADILIGPLSGDEGIAVSNYAKEHQEQTFVDGMHGAQDSTLKVQAPNFFRFHLDGAQWSAGAGDYAYNELGWRKAVTIGDDYSFPYTGVGGFIAEFCGVGGEIVERIWPPLGETDYASFISQIPDIPEEADGIFAAVGGTGTIAFIKQYIQQRGPLKEGQFIGNIFYDDPLVVKELGNQIAGAIVPNETAADSNEPQTQQYIAEIDAAFPDLAEFASSVFIDNYYKNAEGLIQGIEAVDGNIEDLDAFWEALANVEVDAGYGHIRLDENRQAIGPNYLKQVTENPETGELEINTIRRIPEVDQQFGGVFTEDTPAPDRSNPTCEEADIPWAGEYEEVDFGE
jgi:branched-chain amino acid transport system substrate-binding protein